MFEVGMGSVFWIYLAEVCNNKATACAVAYQYFWQIIIGLLVPPMMNKWLTDGKVFIIFGSGSTIGFVYMYFFAKETRGLTDA